jgi:hypothetical protein
MKKPQLNVRAAKAFRCSGVSPRGRTSRARFSLSYNGLAEDEDSFSHFGHSRNIFNHLALRFIQLAILED